MDAEPQSEARAVRAYFRNFAEHQAPKNGSPLYQALSYGVVDDPEMLDLACCCPASQPSANLLFAAVHYLLLRGVDDPLRAFYPDVLVGSEAARPADEGAYESFRLFVARHRAEILGLLRTRLVQTNVVRRSTLLLPAFARVAEFGSRAPLALIEVGSSAGLILLWDRYHHRYERSGERMAEWGDRGSALRLATELRGEAALPELPADLRVASRSGVDVHPLDPTDPDQRLWLRALIFPEHLERHAEIESAARILRSEPPSIVAGDVLDRLPELVRRAPNDATLCIYASVVLYQLAPDTQRRFFELLEALSLERPLFFVTLDGTAEGHAELRLIDIRDGARQEQHLADAHPHGRWLHWR